MAQNKIKVYDGKHWAGPIIKLGRTVVHESKITPEIAEEWLAHHNQSNRPIKKQQVEIIARHIRRGMWHELGNTISFYTTGQLADGQNRLSAIVKAGQAVETNVTFGVNQAAKMFIDTGKSRSLTDRFTLVGHDWAGKSIRSAKFLLEVTSIEEGKMGQVYDDDVRGLMKKHGGVFESIAKIVRTKGFNKQPALSAISFMCLEAPSQVARIEEFARQYNDGVNIASAESPAYRLRQFALDQRRSNSGPFRKELFLKTISAVRAFLNGIDCKRLFVADMGSVSLDGIYQRRL